MGTDRLISDRNGNQEKALELDRAHSEEADQQCYKTSLEMEPTGGKGRGDDRRTTGAGIYRLNGRQWALLGIN